MTVHVEVDPPVVSSPTSALEAGPLHRTTALSQRRRPQGAVEHCPGRQPMHTCYSVELPGYPTCPLGHAIVAYSSIQVAARPHF
jgi:hypothetical protein